MAASSRPLRVCHVAYTFYEYDNRVMRYAETISQRGGRVDAIVLRRRSSSRRACVNGVNLYRIQTRAGNERQALAYLLRILLFLIRAAVLLGWLHLRRRYDVVHVHNVPDFLVFAACVPRLTGARVILDIHDIVPELYAAKFGSPRTSGVFRALMWLERASCRFAHHVIVANHLWRDVLVERAVAADQCTAIINYPDLARFKPTRVRGPQIDGKFVFLYPGTLNHHQGVDLAVRAFARAKPRMPQAELQIYGEGPARPGLSALIRECALEDSVSIRDYVPLDQVAAVMSSADTGVVPKRADGFGNEAFSTKSLEFMACEVPLIISRTRVDQHYFDDTVVHFFTPGDETDLAETMCRSYDRRGCEAALVQRAKAFAVRNSWQAHAEDYCQIMRRLVPAAAGAAGLDLGAASRPAHRGMGSAR